MRSIGSVATFSGGNDPGELVWIEFELDDSPSTLSEAIRKYLARVALRFSLPREEDVVNSVSFNEPTVADEEGLAIYDSFPFRFVRGLRSTLDGLCQRGDDPDLYSEEEEELLEMLTELVKPAILVDGQHRVYGAHTLEMAVPFSVCALSTISWEELVFQFVVINQKAQPIAPEFLHAIANSFLTPSEFNRLNKHLSTVGSDIEEHQMMDRVNHDPESPFHGLMKFKIADGKEKLPYPGMRYLANQFRCLTPDPRFSNIAAHLCSGETIVGKKREWAKEKWFDYFCVFWGTIKDQ